MDEVAKKKKQVVHGKKLTNLQINVQHKKNKTTKTIDYLHSPFHSIVNVVPLTR